MKSTQVLVSSAILGGVIGLLQNYVVIPIADKNKSVDEDTKNKISITTGITFAILIAGFTLLNNYQHIKNS